METYFASAQRASDEELLRDIDFAGKNPIINGLLRTASGLLAVLNEHRQILLLNDSFLETLGIDDAQKVLGLRPGEAINCIHAHEMPGGCGTSRFCSTCGAAMAIVASLATEEPIERKCIATVERNAKITDLCLKVRSVCIKFEEQKFILLFLQDITALQRWAAIENIFFHDVNNLIMALQGSSELLLRGMGENVPKSLVAVYQASVRLSHEVAIQKTLLNEELFDYQPAIQEVDLEKVIDDIQSFFINHPAARDRSIHLPEIVPLRSIRTDVSLLLRILTNMVTNALEATEQAGLVRLWIEKAEGEIIFCVWNSETIPQDIALRVFQRHFSTKHEPGRGLGTYAMKLFGEQFLGGKVDFVTSKLDGTIFRLHLPVEQA